MDTLESLTHAFVDQGYRGDELMKRVFAAGVVMAMLAGHTEAESHFRKRLAELEGDRVLITVCPAAGSRHRRVPGKKRR